MVVTSLQSSPHVSKKHGGNLHSEFELHKELITWRWQHITGRLNDHCTVVACVVLDLDNGVS